MTPTEIVARALCHERRAFRGEPACWKLTTDNSGAPLRWQPPNCDSLGCMASAKAVIAALHAAGFWDVRVHQTISVVYS